VQRLQRNLTCVLGEPPSEPMLRDAVRSYARYWLEAFRLPSQLRGHARRLPAARIFKLLGQAHETGTGAVVALPHAGNWDAAGALVTAHGVPLTTVAERLRPEGSIAGSWPTARASACASCRSTGGAPPMDLLMEAVKAAHVVPLLADRDLSAAGSRSSSSAAARACRPARRCSRSARAHRFSWSTCGTRTSRAAR
jgi:KDO2-lipid IV(A) lauroyltransferase